MDVLALFCRAMLPVVAVYLAAAAVIYLIGVALGVA